MIEVSRSQASKDRATAVRQAELRDMVKLHRTNLIEAGATVTIASYAAPIPMQGAPSDREFLQTLESKVLARMARGDPAGTTYFRDADNVTHVLNDAQVLDLVSAARDWLEQIMGVSFLIMDDPSGISEAFADDPRWPGAVWP